MSGNVSTRRNIGADFIVETNHTKDRTEGNCNTAATETFC